jgi:hypothetical protein
MVGGLGQLSFEFRPQAVGPPRLAVAAAIFFDAQKGVGLCRVVAYADDDVEVKGAYRHSTGRLERMTNRRFQLLRVGLAGHQRPFSIAFGKSTQVD